MARPQVAHQVNGLCVPVGPTTNRRYWAVGRGRHPDVLDCHHGAGFDAGPHDVEAKAVACELRCGLVGRAADVRPAQLIQGPLQLGAIELAIAQKHHLGTQRDHVLDLLHQLEMRASLQ